MCSAGFQILGRTENLPEPYVRVGPGAELTLKISHSKDLGRSGIRVRHPTDMTYSTVLYVLGIVYYSFLLVFQRLMLSVLFQPLSRSIFQIISQSQ